MRRSPERSPVEHQRGRSAGRRARAPRSPPPHPWRHLYGDPSAGDPIQYDELRIEHHQGDVEIVVYNRAILRFMSDTEALRRIHQVCCRLDDIAGSRHRA